MRPRPHILCSSLINIRDAFYHWTTHPHIFCSSLIDISDLLYRLTIRPRPKTTPKHYPFYGFWPL